MNQVLLALIFAAFSTAGFAQSQTTWPPESLVKRVVDQRYQYVEDDVQEDEEDDSNNEDGPIITKEERNSIQYLIKNSGNAIIYEGYLNYVPNQQ